MLRPRESHELRLLSMDLTTEPAGSISWAQDVAGNSVATVSFREATSRLVISSVAETELYALPWPVFEVAASAISYPFKYSSDELTDLGANTIPLYPDSSSHLQEWTKRYIRGDPTDTLSLLKDLNAGVAADIYYRSREDEGTQSPVETLNLKAGSCRDMAVLFVEAARILGFGARIVSGYLHNLNQQFVGSEGPEGPGSTHAWAELYLPGAGLVTFDPMNKSVGSVNLIPVAVGRSIDHVTPVAGNFVGDKSSLIDLSVDVTVKPSASSTISAV